MDILQLDSGWKRYTAAKATTGAEYRPEIGSPFDRRDEELGDTKKKLHHKQSIAAFCKRDALHVWAPCICKPVASHDA